MPKVHPNADPSEDTMPAVSGDGVALLTVWRKSLLFNGNGFTVFDAKGNLVFRVDNYAKGSGGDIVLMDGAGNPLLTFRRKKLSLVECWQIYDGEESAKPRFSVRKHVSLLHPSALAHVTPHSCTARSGGGCEVEGSYSERRCVVYDETRRQLAVIRRKETATGGVAIGLDVFRLVVEPGVDVSFAMAIVILLDQMFGSRSWMRLLI
ncbi:protein LURP-one-related 8-like [Typha latifolia]|uniref:protein LURP-one-related 8-like n=1 Tax=Typha latifolia TaxID=4733 RepID=UPI003C2BF817